MPRTGKRPAVDEYSRGNEVNSSDPSKQSRAGSMGRLPIVIGATAAVILGAVYAAGNTSYPGLLLATAAHHEGAGNAPLHSADGLSPSPMKVIRPKTAITSQAKAGHVLLLTGVVVSSKSLALVSIDGHPAQPYAVGEDLAKGVVLCQVNAFGVVIRHDGTTEKLGLHRVNVVANDTAPVDAVAPLIPAPTVPLAMRQAIHEQGGDWFVLDRNYVTAYLKSKDFLTQGRIVSEPDGGFRIVDLNPVGLFAQLGLDVGDVVRDISVNGQSVNAIADMANVFHQIGGAQQVQLEVLTNGRTRYLRYNLR